MFVSKHTFLLALAASGRLVLMRWGASPRYDFAIDERDGRVIRVLCKKGLQDLVVGSTDNIGRGWVNASPLDHLLLCVPFLHGPQLDWCHIADDFHVRFLWLIPVSESERDFRSQHGLEGLGSTL